MSINAWNLASTNIFYTLLTPNRNVEVEELQRAVTITDPEIDTDKLDKLLIWAYKVSDKSELSSATPIDIAEIKQRLIYGDIQRVGMRPDM